MKLEQALAIVHTVIDEGGRRLRLRRGCPG